MSADVSPRDRGQVGLMRKAGLSANDRAPYSRPPEEAPERTSQGQRADCAAKTLRPISSQPSLNPWKQQEARALELARNLDLLLSHLCEHPGHGRGSCMEAAWDLADEVVWLLDSADDRPMPRVRAVRT